MDELLQFVARDGARLASRCWWPATATNGSTLVLLHGAASNSSRWWRLVANTSLRDRHCLLRPDLRGHGLSLHRPPARLEDWSLDLLELLDRTGQQQAILVGHCLGANLALFCAAQHPERIRGLVLLEPMLPSALRGPLASLRRWAPLLRWLRSGLRAANAIGLRRRNFPLLDLQALDQQFADRLGDAVGNAALAARYGSVWQDLRYLPVAQYLQNLLELLRPLPLLRIACPTLALLGSGSLLTDPSCTRRELLAIPDLQLVQVAAEHWIPTEAPVAMQQAIEDFVAALAGTPAGPG